jgi:hypothetical protein
MGILRRTVVDWLGKVVEAEKVDSAEALVQLILRDYIPAFQKLRDSISAKYGALLETL